METLLLHTKAHQRVGADVRGGITLCGGRGEVKEKEVMRKLLVVILKRRGGIVVQIVQFIVSVGMLRSMRCER
jgi:hypothetical protein